MLATTTYIEKKRIFILIFEIKCYKEELIFRFLSNSFQKYVNFVPKYGCVALRWHFQSVKIKNVKVFFIFSMNWTILKAEKFNPFQNVRVKQLSLYISSVCECGIHCWKQKSFFVTKSFLQYYAAIKSKVTQTFLVCRTKKL